MQCAETKQQQLHLVMDAGFVRTMWLCLCMEVAVLFAAYSHPPVRFWAMDSYQEIKLKMLGAAHLTFVCVSFVYCVCVVCVICVRVLVCEVRVRVEFCRRLSQNSTNAPV